MVRLLGWGFYSELVIGKGMSSSTADIVATIRCRDKINDRITGGSRSVLLKARFCYKTCSQKRIWIHSCIIKSISGQTIIYGSSFYLLHTIDGRLLDCCYPDGEHHSITGWSFKRIEKRGWYRSGTFGCNNNCIAVSFNQQAVTDFQQPCYPHSRYHSVVGGVWVP